MTRLASVSWFLLPVAIVACSDDDTSPTGGTGGATTASATSTATSGNTGTATSSSVAGSGSTTAVTTTTNASATSSSTGQGGGPELGPDAVVAVRFTGGDICYRHLTQVTPAPDGWIIAGDVMASEDDLNAPCSIALGATVVEPPHVAQRAVDFVAKVSTAGAVEWTVAFANHAGTGLRDIVVDGDGNVNVVGRIRIDATTTVSWLKIDPTGQVILVDAPQVPFDAQHVKVHPDGDLVFASSGMVAKMALDGSLEAITTFDFGGVSGDIVEGLAIAPDGHVFFTGPSASVQTGSDVGVAMVDEHLNPVWSTVLGGSNDQTAHGIASDGGTGVLFAGNFGGQITLGVNTISGSDVGFDPNGFLGRLDVNGAPVGLKGFGNSVASSCCSGPSLASDSTGDFVLGGGTSVIGASGGTLDFGGGPIDVTENAFLARWAASGDPTWARVFDGRELIDEIAIAADGTIGVVGKAFEALDLGTGPLPDVNGYGDVFFAVFPPQ